ncbi:MAG: cobalamin biosynthesis protein [Actinobacteria bacterium]|nr:MAG: cobalamin biosynthesis protein [Actinomycetota bacterium]
MAAWLVDRWAGDPARFHPVAGFGRVAAALAGLPASRFLLLRVTRGPDDRLLPVTVRGRDENAWLVAALRELTA